MVSFFGYSDGQLGSALDKGKNICDGKSGGNLSNQEKHELQRAAEQAGQRGQDASKVIDTLKSKGKW